VKIALVLLWSASLFLVGCAATSTASPERQREVRDRAQAWLRTHPEIDRYEVDRFANVTAYYRMGGGASGTGATQPFFDCVFTRR
jgi:outer membrane biogenesis lipoprotein LolB